ncbi:hypothetical protein [Paraburkholderia sp. 2C]
MLLRAFSARFLLRAFYCALFIALCLLRYLAAVFGRHFWQPRFAATFAALCRSSRLLFERIGGANGSLM